MSYDLYVREISRWSGDSVLQTQKRHVVGYFDSDTSPDFKIYHKVASVLRDDCTFHAAIGSELASLLSNNHRSRFINAACGSDELAVY